MCCSWPPSGDLCRERNGVKKEWGQGGMGSRVKECCMCCGQFKFLCERRKKKKISPVACGFPVAVFVVYWLHAEPTGSVKCCAEIAYSASYDMIQGRVSSVPCFKLINESNGALASSIHGYLPDTWEQRKFEERRRVKERERERERENRGMEA